MTQLSRVPGAHELRTVAPGVVGYYYRCEDGLVTVPLIQAVSPGNGDVARFLDGLPHDERIRFCCVVSPKLVEMLVKRGFCNQPYYIDEIGEWDHDAYYRAATA